MPVPLAIAATGAVAAGAYLNARARLGHDLRLIKIGIVGRIGLILRERRDRLNMFYELETRATSPATAKKTVLVFEGRSLSYAQLYDRVLRVGFWLRHQLGVQAGDFVALDFQNSDSFIVLWWALWSIGARPAFINSNLTGKPLAHCIKAATTKLVLIDPHVAEHFDDALRAELGDSGSRFFVFTPEAEAKALDSPPTRLPDSDRSAEDMATTALLIYTSGTTGLPKPALVSWSKVYGAGIIGTSILGRKADDILYTSMPLYHSSAALLALVSTILSGSTVVLGRKFSTKGFWKDVRESKATIIQYVGETLRYLLAAPPEIDPATGQNLDKQHHVRMAFGNGLRPDIWNKFKERFAIETVAEFYAATEGMFGTFNISSNDLSAGAIGRSGWLNNAVQGLSVTLVQVDWDTDLPYRDPATGFCKKVASGEPGEMIFKLPADDIRSRFQGYHGNPEATAAKMMHDVFTKGDVYYRTGDMVRWTNDGLIYFSDRIGDTFRWKSENVSTAEVSEAVGLHPSVREANVYGVELPHHDGRAGCVAINFDKEPDTETLRSLASHVRSSLPKYAQPLFLRLVSGDLGAEQTTGTNKQQKHQLRQSGVKPAPGVQLYWLNGPAYVPFEDKDWKRLVAGQVKL